MKITVRGSSDDLIEIEGDIVEEFNWYSSEDPDDERVLAFSDGTLLRVAYDKDGLWHFNRLMAGSAVLEKIEGDVEADRGDVIHLTGDIKWVTFGDSWAKR